MNINRVSIMTSIPVKRLLSTLSVAAVLVASAASAQIRSISVYTDYASPLTKRLNVQRIDAVGGGVHIDFSVFEHVSIGLRGGYGLYSINQPDQLNQWGWTFWNDRYLNKIQADMRADPSLSAVIGSVQKMDLIPVALSLEYTFNASEDWAIMPWVSGGIAFYSRRLYADETWTKQFPAANYSFTYNFRNFAPSKNGSVFNGGAGCTLQYRLFKDMNVSASAAYTQHVSTWRKAGYAEFPVESELDFRVGVDFLY